MRRVLIQDHLAPCQRGARRHIEKRGLTLLGMHTVWTHTHSTIVDYILVLLVYDSSSAYIACQGHSKCIVRPYMYYSTSIYEYVVIVVVCSFRDTHGVCCLSMRILASA
jgi:hypothetical protein